MDKVTIVLQDKHTIEELAKDPEVQIRIKDAIADCVGRRAMKIANVADMIANTVKNDLFSYCYVGGHELKDEWKDVIRRHVKDSINKTVDDAMQSVKSEVHDAITALKEDLVYRLENYDLNVVIREAAEKVVREKFK